MKILIVEDEGRIAKRVERMTRDFFGQTLQSITHLDTLQDALKHIQYVKNIDSLSLKKQYEQVLGTYSIEENELKRNFWLKNGRLYYKREGLPSKELLPISETRYMNMSEPQFNYEFEYKNGEVLACFAWFFNPETMTWENFNPDLNYLYKE